MIEYGHLTMGDPGGRLYSRTERNAFMKLALALILAAASSAAFAQNPGGPGDIGKSVYGADDREDFYEASYAARKAADSVVALFDKDKVTFEGTTARLKTKKLGEARKLCRGEKFYDQPSGAACSGSLVGPDLVMTAGHCIPTPAMCAYTRFVFGFTVKSPGQTAFEVPSAEVYSCAALVAQTLSIDGDYALVRLDRPVPNHQPLKLNRTGIIKTGTPLFVIGHPSGLPQKIAGGAKVRSVSGQNFFLADLDTFGGNSGSPVFNGRTGLLEGILYKGGADYVPGPDGACNVTYRTGQNAGKGEGVTQIAKLLSFIPAPKAPGPEEVRSVDAGGDMPEAPDNAQVERLNGLLAGE